MHRHPGDEALMDRALALAARGPVADPNPRVGCVLADRHGTVLADGWHEGAGTPHAEAAALAQARARGAEVAGSTAYVTLEPCAHQGRTGPCTDALLAAGVGRVVIGTRDVNPEASGGAAILRTAGIDVTCGVRAERAEQLNHAWLTAMGRGRPYVTWKFAATLDGRSAAADGTSRWISSAAAREHTHELRGRCQAVMVGTGTVLADDPHLTVRQGGALAPRQPLRVVVGRRDLPAGARVLDAAAPTLHLRTRDPRQALAELQARGIRQVWLEGGPRLAAAFLAEDLVDEVVAVVAPKLLGAGAAAVADLGVRTIGQARDLCLTSVTQVGEDVLLRLRPRERGAC